MKTSKKNYKKEELEKMPRADLIQAYLELQSASVEQKVVQPVEYSKETKDRILAKLQNYKANLVSVQEKYLAELKHLINRKVQLQKLELPVFNPTKVTPTSAYCTKTINATAKLLEKLGVAPKLLQLYNAGLINLKFEYEVTKYCNGKYNPPGCRFVDVEEARSRGRTPRQEAYGARKTLPRMFIELRVSSFEYHSSTLLYKSNFKVEYPVAIYAAVGDSATASRFQNETKKQNVDMYIEQYMLLAQESECVFNSMPVGRVNEKIKEAQKQAITKILAQEIKTVDALKSEIKNDYSKVSDEYRKKLGLIADSNRVQKVLMRNPDDMSTLLLEVNDCIGYLRGNRLSCKA